MFMNITFILDCQVCGTHLIWRRMTYLINRSKSSLSKFFRRTEVVCSSLQFDVTESVWSSIDPKEPCKFNMNSGYGRQLFVWSSTFLLSLLVQQKHFLTSDIKQEDYVLAEMSQHLLVFKMYYQEIHFCKTPPKVFCLDFVQLKMEERVVKPCCSYIYKWALIGKENEFILYFLAYIHTYKHILRYIFIHMPEYIYNT